MSPDRGELPAALPTHLELRGPLGAGGSGEVWAARDRRAGVDVAVKFVRLRPGGPGAERLEREARALARAGGHPAVVALREVGTDGHRWGWLVSELVDGTPWSTFVGSGPPALRPAARPTPPPALVAAGAARVADGLAALHALDAVHGDVTPANVVDAPGRGPVLVDLGLAELGDPVPPSGDGDDPGPAPVAMTPAYAAPERRRGRPPRPAGDLWSLGATVLAVCTGAPPDPLAVRLRVPGHLAGPLAEVLDALLAVNPRARPDAVAASAAFAAAVARVGPHE